MCSTRDSRLWIGDGVTQIFLKYDRYDRYDRLAASPLVP
jgi:hypothetical protein